MPRGIRLAKLGNRQVRPTIFAVMQAMPIADRQNWRKIGLAVKAQGFKEPTEMTIKKNQKEFLATNPAAIALSAPSNGNITPGKIADDHISLHDLAEIATHKDLFQRIGPEKFKKALDILG